MTSVFLQLVRRDLVLFKHGFVRQFINSFIWLFSTVIVSKYVMPAMGIEDGYGAFILVGSIASLSLFRCVHSIPILLGDVEGEGAISYYLTLPMKQYMVFVRYAASFGITAAITSISMLITSKFILWNVFDLSKFSIIKFVVIFLIMHLFVGFFTVLVTAYTPSMRYLENVWTRVIFPIWFLGGYQFTWATIYKQIPVLAYINLFNPMTYILEAFRASFLGQAGYLNFWACCCMILLFTFLSAYFGIRKFMTRLDCVS
jgi:ABC-type polysaccharide/polyol phosphate export permease